MLRAGREAACRIGVEDVYKDIVKNICRNTVQLPWNVIVLHLEDGRAEGS